MLKQEVADKMTELWKPMTGYENYYEISNYCRIRSISRLYQTGNGHGWRMSKQRILKPSKSGRYLKQTINAGCIKKTFLLHRIGALTWIPNPNNLPQINHIDTNKLNNYIGNLEWCTMEYNMAHAAKNGLCKVGANHNTHVSNRRKSIIQYDLHGVEIKKWKSITEASIALEFDKGFIIKCAKGKVKSAYNFIFKYA